MARGLKTNRTKTIGIVLPELNNIFFAEIIIEAEDILRSHGYATMICDCRSDAEREKEALEFLYHRRVDGLIVMPAGSSDPGFKRFTRAGRPIVMIDRKMQDVSCDCILVDNEGAARDAVKRLVNAGHRKIGMIAGPEDIYTAKERLKGFRAAVREAGADTDEALIARGNYTIEGGAAAMWKLHEQNPDMTAVFISNYEMTVGAMMEINDLGIRVPDELSVIGFDNVDFARASVPKLSIVTQPTAMIAKSAADILLGRLEGRIPEEYENEIFERFPFKPFKKESWDLEHIDSYTKNAITDFESQKKWLELASSDLDINSDIKKKLHAKIEEFYSSTTKDRADLFNNLKQEVIRYAGEDPGNNEKQKNSIGNITLLNRHINRSYGNAIFPTKRRIIIEHDRDGKFIPHCTRNVFLKYFNPKGGSLVKWSSDDIAAYMLDIQNTIKVFLS